MRSAPDVSVILVQSILPSEGTLPLFETYTTALKKAPACGVVGIILILLIVKSGNST